MPFVLVMKNFLGNYKAENYVEIVNSILDNFRDLGFNMRLKGSLLIQLFR